MVARMNFKKEICIFIFTKLTITCLERTSPDFSNGNQLTSRRNKKSRSIKKKGTENEDEDEDFKRLKSLDSNEWESMPEATIALKNYSTSICPVLGRIL